MIKKIMRKTVVLALSLLIIIPVFAVSLPVLAAIDTNSFFRGGNDTGTANEFANKSGLPGQGLEFRDLIESIIAWVMGFLGIIAVVVILIGGFKWMTAGGNEDKVGEAKKLLIAGLIGLIIVVLAYAIAVFVLAQLIDITNN
ncbi:MAG: pilin [bacterium]|nr:pilin [bacterium]